MSKPHNMHTAKNRQKQEILELRIAAVSAKVMTLHTIPQYAITSTLLSLNMPLSMNNAHERGNAINANISRGASNTP